MHTPASYYSAVKDTSKVLLERCGGGEVRAELVVEGWTYYDWANKASVKARMNRGLARMRNVLCSGVAA